MCISADITILDASIPFFCEVLLSCGNIGFLGKSKNGAFKFDQKNTSKELPYLPRSIVLVRNLKISGFCKEGNLMELAECMDDPNKVAQAFAYHYEIGKAYEKSLAELDTSSNQAESIK